MDDFASPSVSSGVLSGGSASWGAEKLRLCSHVLFAFAYLWAALLPALAQKPNRSAPSRMTPTYAHDIQPILEARCVVCHNASTAGNAAVSGGLALDTYAAIQQGVAGQKSRPILGAGHASGSALYARLIASSPAKLMPKGGPALPPAQIALIKQWIDANAPPGDLAKIARGAPLKPESLPMPLDSAVLDVWFPTRVDLPMELREKGKTNLTIGFKVGPLPPITSLTYSPDGRILAIGGYRYVAIWDTVKGQPLTCLTHFPGAVLALGFRPDGSLLAVGSGVPGTSGDIRLFDTSHFLPVGKPFGGHSDVVASLCWSADGMRLASGSQDKTARVWEWPSGKVLQVFKDHSDGVTQVCFAPDGKSLYTASLDHNARRFDIDKGSLIRLFTGHNDAIMAMALSPDGKRLVTSGGEPNMRWWNVETGDTTNNNGGHSAAVSEVRFARDGKLVASASADKTLRIWDGSNTQPKRALEGSQDWLYSTVISPDDRFAAGGGADGIVRLWETATGRLRLSILLWPPQQDSARLDWLVMTPEGYFDGSPAWTAMVKAGNLAKTVSESRAKEMVQVLFKKESILKAWEGATLEPAKIAAK